MKDVTDEMERLNQIVEGYGDCRGLRNMVTAWNTSGLRSGILTHSLTMRLCTGTATSGRGRVKWRSSTANAP